ncbi:MAG: thioether cross-link-forming SCIFF peptide maturase [Oscillospiraceae bacterium]|nr:thioether cross-link-forming SCIFF peptide maturase [Oscillospiraceae bacterium]
MGKSAHAYVCDGKYIVLDVNSGGVHLTDKLCYDMIVCLSASANTPGFALPVCCPDEFFSVFAEHSRSEIIECYDEIAELYNAGLLFSSLGYEQFAKESVGAPLKALCLHVAHDCNLRCEYCFADTGGFGGERNVMSSLTAQKAVDFLIENSGEREILEIDFFGGEPLMAWDTVRTTVEYARSLEKKCGKRFNFTLTTNGLLLDDEKSEFINREMSNIVLSLDGRKQINDLMRKTKNRASSYDIILPKYKRLVEGRTKPGRTDYFIRGTFTKHNLDFCEDVLAIAREGFTEISLEPAVVNENLPFSLTRQDIPRIKDEYERLYSIMKEPNCGFRFFHFDIDLNQGPCAIKRLRGCGCANEYVAVTPNGDIYPCHQFVGIERWKMGCVHNKPAFSNHNIKEYFCETHVYTKKECQNCWAKFYCSGGCNAVSYIHCGDVRASHEISCELMKKRIEYAISLNIR